MHKHKILSLIFFILLIRTTYANEIGIYEVFEKRVQTHKIYSNEFIEIDITGKFISPNGKTVKVKGFYDEENTWIVRFSPDELGIWEYKIISSDPELNAEGTFISIPSNHHGLLKVDKDYPHWFIYEDGFRELIISEGAFPWGDWADKRFGYISSFEDWKKYIDNLVAHGIKFNSFWYWSFCWSPTLEDTDTNSPYRVIDAKKFIYDKDRFNLNFFQRLDSILSYANSKGFYIGINIFDDTSIEDGWKNRWAKHPANSKNGGWLDSDYNKFSWFDIAQWKYYIKSKIKSRKSGRPEWYSLKEPNSLYQKRYLDYLLARTSAYRNVVYHISSETNETYENIVVPWLYFWFEYIEQNDPYGHLITPNQTHHSIYDNNKTDFIMNWPHIDFIALDSVNKLGERYWRYNKPYFLGEVDEKETIGIDSLEEQRRFYWTAFVSGYRAARPQPWNQTIRDIEGEGTFYDYILYLTDFIKEFNIHYWEMSIHDDLIESGNAYCLAVSGHQYIVYLPAGGEVTLNLIKSLKKVQIYWYNPRDGRHQTGEASPNNNIINLQAPDSHDWAVFIDNPETT